jgi:hypothetical protein
MCTYLDNCKLFWENKYLFVLFGSSLCMNPNLKALYVAIYADKVEIVETNLSSFVEKVNESYKGSRNYKWFHRSFAKADYFKVELDGKEYSFQRLL